MDTIWELVMLTWEAQNVLNQQPTEVLYDKYNAK